MLGEQVDCGEVLEVLVVSNYIDWSIRTFEVMPPSSECLKYSEEFLVMSVIIEFGDAQGVRVESDRVDFTIGGDCREDCGNGIVRGIGFDYKQGSRDEVQEDWSRGKCRFQRSL